MATIEVGLAQSAMENQWEGALTSLTTANFEAVLTLHGHLLLKFSSIEVLLDRNEVEALTRFLEKEAGVEPLPGPSDEDLFAQD